jgi:hypothetical protein
LLFYTFCPFHPTAARTKSKALKEIVEGNELSKKEGGAYAHALTQQRWNFEAARLSII